MPVKKDMPKRYHLNRSDLAQAVAQEMRACREVKSQQRLLAAQLAASGQFTAAQIAEQLGISRRRFFDWMSALKSGGVAGLLERGHGGGALPCVRGRALAELQAGLQAGRWKRAKEIQHWLHREYGVGLQLHGVYYRRENPHMARSNGSVDQHQAWSQQGTLAARGQRQGAGSVAG